MAVDDPSLEQFGTEWPLIGLLLLDLIVMVWALLHLPERVPTHWNLQGQVDAYGSSWMNAVLPTVMAWGIYWGMGWLPRMDPKRKSYAKFPAAYRVIRWSLTLYFLGLHLVLIAVSLGLPVDVAFVIRLAVAALFVVLGNEFGRIRQNFFVGIRLPWTLSDEQNWNRTHRMAGKLWVMGGLAMLAAAFLPNRAGFVVLLAIAAVLVIVPIVYSYQLFRRSQA